jgi:Predicted transcriptional regulator
MIHYTHAAVISVFENREVTTMEVSYKKLWKILIDKDMKKKDLQVAAGISWASVTKLSKGETVSMEVLMKVCKALDCNIGDIMDFIPTDGDSKA